MRWFRRTLTRLACCMLVTALTAAGCGGGESISAASTEPMLLVHDSEGGMDALLVGRLRYLSGPKCFVIESDTDPSVKVVPVFPARSRPVVRDGAVVAVDVPDFGTVPVDSLIRAGGGDASADMKPPRLPAECEGAERPFLIDRITEAK